MQKLRENSFFKIAAIFLGLCFAILIFHSVVHLGHTLEEEHHCPVCVVLSLLAIIFTAAFLILSQCKEKSSSATHVEPSFSYVSPFIELLAGRAPPISM